MEDMYLEVDKKIRESPAHEPTKKNKPTGDALEAENSKREGRGGIWFTDADGNAKFINRCRRPLAQRKLKNRVEQRKAFVLNSLADGDDDKEEEDAE